ncbi:hypothetical protein C4D60_Mb01t22850 [Musa balbisiana]|uniref:Uncharacterized protein n=1 Tax=Musa balbisiana TaxID=52838 RepID=A0A4V6T4I2_MUSBA|nr:hypothetical protein C4D60_Mb01t22850 [Musa balbisiana]
MPHKKPNPASYIKSPRRLRREGERQITIGFDPYLTRQNIKSRRPQIPPSRSLFLVVAAERNPKLLRRPVVEMSATEADTKPKEGENAAVAPAAGEVLYCGGTNWDMLGRMGGPNAANLVSPTRLRPLVGVDIRFVASGCRRMCVVLISKRLFSPTRLRPNAAATLFSRFAHISKRLLSLFVENDAKKAPSTRVVVFFTSDESNNDDVIRVEVSCSR